MFILGIAPGVQALAYSVLSWEQGRPPELLDADVLRAGRQLILHDLADVGKKFYTHKLILDVVLERHPPMLLCVGPPANAKENPDHVAVVRVGVRFLAQTFAVPVLELADPEALHDALDVESSRQLATQVRASLGSAGALPRDRRAFMALAAAVAGHRHARSQGPAKRST